MRSLILILFLNIVNINLFAQDLTDSINPNTKFRKNAVFIEIGGSSFFGFSFNFKRNLLLNKDISLSGCIGAGFSVSPYISLSPLFPIRVNINLKNIELGIGISNFIKYADKNMGINQLFRPIVYEYNYGIFNLNPHPIIGYKIINKNNISFYISISTLILIWREDSPLIVPWIGIKYVVRL